VASPALSPPTALVVPPASPAPSVEVPAQPSVGAIARQTLRALREAFDAHDAGKVASYYAEDCVVDSTVAMDARGTRPAHGRDELASGLGKVFAAFGDIASAPLRTWVTGNVVVSEIAWTATMTGDFMGLKATGKPVGLVALRVMRLSDEGLVQQEREYADVSGLVAQMMGKKDAPPPPILPSNTLDMHTAKGTPDEDQLAAWAKGMDQTFDKGDPKGVAAAMDDDADYWTNFGGPAIKGKRALEKGIGAWFKAFPDQKWTTTEAWGIDGFAIVEHSVSGTQQGAFGLAPASKRAVTGWRWVDILQPGVDGAVLHCWGFTNVMEMLQQTGAIKQPALTTTTNVAPPAMRTKGVAAASKKQ